jgi:DNA polymerase I-like protein with 3'-5' exonuclease and polymerase domains
VKAKQIVKVWARTEPFKLSKQSLIRYQFVMKHKPILDPKDKTVTFDEKAILRLTKQYPDDKLYPLILQFRGKQKRLSTYIGVTQPDKTVKGGLPIGEDGAVHPTFTQNPETLRSACQNPNMQNLPRK